MSEQVEILGPSGAVHYRRPVTDKMVVDALKTPGYSVRWPGCHDVSKLQALPKSIEAKVSFEPDGMRVACPRQEGVACEHCGSVHLRHASVSCDY